MLLLTASLGDFSNVSWQLLSQWGKKTVNELLVKLALCYKENFCNFSTETCFIRTSKSYHFELQLLTWSYSLCIKKRASWWMSQYIKGKQCQLLTHSTSYIFMHSKHKDSNRCGVCHLTLHRAFMV